MNMPQGILPDIQCRHMFLQAVGNEKSFIWKDPVRISNVRVELDDLFDPSTHFVTLRAFPGNDNTGNGVANCNMNDLSHDDLPSFSFSNGSGLPLSSLSCHTITSEEVVAPGVRRIHVYTTQMGDISLFDGRALPRIGPAGVG